MAKRRRRRFELAAVVMAAAAGTPPPALAVPSRPTAPARNVDPAAVARMLARFAVRDDAYAFRQVYTWTTAEQIEELRRGARLLSRTESPTRGASYVEIVLHELAGAGDPTAKMLYREAFAKMRFAWPFPWATRMGFAFDEDYETGDFPREIYGDQLVAVTLKREAIVIRISSKDGVIDARDMDGVEVPLATVRASPARVGAIYFTSDASVPARKGRSAAPASYRELVLCNEAMIESWSVGTDAIRQELDDEIAVLELAAAAIGDARVAAAYEAALALRGVTYTRRMFSTYASTLRATPRTQELAAKSTVTFPGVGAVRKPPRVLWRVPGSYGTFYAPPKQPHP